MNSTGSGKSSTVSRSVHLVSAGLNVVVYTDTEGSY